MRRRRRGRCDVGISPLSLSFWAVVRMFQKGAFEALANWAANWPKIASANRRCQAEEPILKKPKKGLITIAGVHVPMGVADTDII